MSGWKRATGAGWHGIAVVLGYFSHLSLVCPAFGKFHFVSQGALQVFCITCTGTTDNTGQMHSLIGVALLDSSAQPQCLLS